MNNIIIEADKISKKKNYIENYINKEYNICDDLELIISNFQMDDFNNNKNNNKDKIIVFIKDKLKKMNKQDIIDNYMIYSMIYKNINNNFIILEYQDYDILRYLIKYFTNKLMDKYNKKFNHINNIIIYDYYIDILINKIKNKEVKNYNLDNNFINLPNRSNNTSNNCFMNSLLQVLLHTKDFIDILLDENYLQLFLYNIINNNNNNNNKIELIKTKFIDSVTYNLYKLFYDIIYNIDINEEKYKMNDLRTIFYNNKLIQTENEQEDIGEFLEYLIGHFNDIIKDIFKNNIKITTTCNNCNIKVTTSDFNYIHKLHIKSKPLDKILEEYNNDEKIKDYKCENCKNIYEATRNTILSETSNILIIQLIRYINNLNYITKNTLQINYNKIIKINNNDYELYAICYHSGTSVYNGHYWSYIKKNNKWYIYDDINGIGEYIDNNNNNDILFDIDISKNGYLLFYKKK